MGRRVEIVPKGSKIPEGYRYRPLPDIVYLKPSSIEGLGLHAKVYIPEGYTIGVTHIALLPQTPMYGAIPDGVVRTPLGGFINHSENPNTILTQKDLVYYLKTTIFVKPDTELTLDYNLKKIGWK
jgi:hypothetical protein